MFNPQMMQLMQGTQGANGQGAHQFPQGFADYLQQYKNNFNNQFGMNPGDVARPRMMNYLQNQNQGVGQQQYQPIRQVANQQGFMPQQGMMNNPMMRMMLQQYLQSIIGQGGMPQYGSLV